MYHGRDSEAIWLNDCALKRARSLDFMFTFYPPNHVWLFDPKCICNYSIQRGDWRILYGLYSRWLSIQITLWFDLNLADSFTVRNHNPSQGCGLIMCRSFLNLTFKHLVKEKDKKKNRSIRSLTPSTRHLWPLILKHWTCRLVLQIAYILSLGCLASRLKVRVCIL